MTNLGERDAHSDDQFGRETDEGRGGCHAQRGRPGEFRKDRLCQIREGNGGANDQNEPVRVRIVRQHGMCFEHPPTQRMWCEMHIVPSAFVLLIFVWFHPKLQFPFLKGPFLMISVWY